MITFSRLGDHGRFGNQLFQYALLCGVEAKTGLEAIFPASSPANPHLLNALRIDPKRFTTERLTKEHLYKEKQYHFDDCVFKVKDGTDFFGYFQTEKYFEHIADTMRRELMPTEHYFTLAADRLTHARTRFGKDFPITVVHMRRGDNVHGGGMDPAEHAKFIPCQPLSYYRNALHVLEQHPSVGPSIYIVLSNTPDDAKWSEENFPLERGLYYGGPEEDPLVDFATMIMGDHLVISNSTMSWWAGWLRDGQPRIQTYPTLWFGPNYAPPRYQLHDLWPKRPNWVQVNSF